MLARLLVASAGASDPAALRQLHQDAPWAVDLGTDGLSVAADLSGPLVGLTWRPGAWVGASVGTARVLWGEERRWGVDATAAAGLAALLATPGVALTGTAAVRYGYRGDRLAVTGGLVLPAAVRLDWPPEAVLPTDLELTAGVRLGGLWIGGRSSVGGAFVPGDPPSLRAGAALWIRPAASPKAQRGQ